MSASKLEPKKATFTRTTLPTREELVRLIKSAQRHGIVHKPRKDAHAEPPKHKLQIAS